MWPVCTGSLRGLRAHALALPTPLPSRCRLPSHHRHRHRLACLCPCAAAVVACDVAARPHALPSSPAHREHPSRPCQTFAWAACLACCDVDLLAPPRPHKNSAAGSSQPRSELARLATSGAPNCANIAWHLPICCRQSRPCAITKISQTCRAAAASSSPFVVPALYSLQQQIDVLVAALVHALHCGSGVTVLSLRPSRPRSSLRARWWCRLEKSTGLDQLQV